MDNSLKIKSETHEEQPEIKNKIAYGKKPESKHGAYGAQSKSKSEALWIRWILMLRLHCSMTAKIV